MGGDSSLGREKDNYGEVVENGNSLQKLRFENLE